MIDMIIGIGACIVAGACCAFIGLKYNLELKPLIAIAVIMYTAGAIMGVVALTSV